ncbi:MAG: PEP-CTERM sorting domain-containing protein [Kiritimatiellales bacterium]
MRKKWMSIIGIIALWSGVIHADLALRLTGTAQALNAGSVWEFEFTIDGSGNVTVSAGAADQFFTSVADGAAAVVGMVTDTALFNTSFSLQMTNNGDSFGFHTNNATFGRFGVNSFSTTAEATGNRYRIDESSGELIYFDWDLTGLPTGYTFQMTGLETGYANSNGNYSVNGVTDAGFVKNNKDIIYLSTTPAFTGGSNPAPITIGAVNGGDIAPGSIVFSIVPIPEPATAGLVSISTAVLLLFRRLKK